MTTISARIDNVTEITTDYMQEMLPAPKSVKIELTSKCNFYCGFCAHKLDSKTNRDMDFEFFKRITKEMRDAGVEELGLFYIGESFMCSWLSKAIAYAKEIGFPYVFLTTNGSLVSPEKVDAVMAAGLDSLKFSLNNADKWQFRQVTGMAPSVFDLVTKNVKEAFRIRNEKGYKTRIYASSIKYDGEQQKIMQSYVDEIKPFVDEHYWLPLYSFGAQAAEGEKKLGLKPISGNPGRLETMRPPLPCWAVFKEGHVTSEGLLSACCFDNSNQWIMANLNNVDFLTGWNSAEFQALRKTHLSGDVHGTACSMCIHGEK